NNLTSNTPLATLAATNVNFNVKDGTISKEPMEEHDQLMISEGAELPPPLETPAATTNANFNVKDGTISKESMEEHDQLMISEGLLIRLGLVSIEAFAGQQVFALAWPQFIGCILMGLFVSTRKWIDGGFVLPDSPSKGHWVGAFIYVGLSSGLCGSITTFSSWNLALFSELINSAKVARHPLQNGLILVKPFCN
ncbi:hypothetical protein BGZ47_004231, partial [Haplosporangium gracile]